MALDSAAATGNTQPSSGTPWRRAASTEHTTRAAAELTFHCEHSRFVYGVAIIRFPGPGVAISSGP
jgi:hypothetical protein